MSNILTTNPVWVDTADATIFSHPVRVKAIFWVSDDQSNKDIADEDNMKLLDKENGNVVFCKKAEAAGDGIEIDFGPRGVMLTGIFCSELDGGILLIYV